MCCIHREMRREASSGVKPRGVTVCRREGVVGAVESRWRGANTYTHTHTFISSQIPDIHTHRGWILLKRALLELYTCPCAMSFTYAVDGWRTEPNVSTRGAAEKDILADSDERQSRKKAIDFTVLEDAYSAVVSRGGGPEQIKPKDKEYCVLTFPDLSLFCYLLAVCFRPFFMEICVQEEL